MVAEFLKTLESEEGDCQHRRENVLAELLKTGQEMVTFRLKMEAHFVKTPPSFTNFV
jgi:hypothetical protein